MSQPRQVIPGQTVLVTRRTLRRTFLLRPDAVLNQLFLYLVAFFARKFTMQVSAIQVLADHYHMVLTDVLGQLPDFLRELHRMIALCVKVWRKWEGPVWEPCEASTVALLTPLAAAQEMVYTWLNAVRAGLVEDALDWPGVTTRLNDVDGPAIVVKRPTVFLDALTGLWPKQLTLRMTMPPILAALGPEQARRLLRVELKRQLGEARQRVKAHGWRVLGRWRCENVSPYERATSWEPLRSRNPVLAAGRGMREALRRGIAALRTFRQAYRDALEQWCDGVRDVLFPYGTWWMVKHHGARMAEPLPAG